MTRERVFLLLESVLCIMFVAVLCCGAIRIYNEGSARKEADPSENIYTVEGIARAAEPALPILCSGVLVTVTGAALGIRNSRADKPVKDKKLFDHSSSGAAWNTNPMSYAAQKKWRMILLVLGIVFVIAGIANGSMHDVLVKAINVCTECIGLG